MTVFALDPDEDVRIVCEALAFLGRRGCTLTHLETINCVSYQPGTRFGTALEAAVGRGLVAKVGKRYHLTGKEA